MKTSAAPAKIKAPAAKLVISYLRFSTPEQLKGDSKRRQTDLADKWCKEHGERLTDRLSDLGISAFRGRNTREGALAIFLRLVRDGTVPTGSILLVEELDRLSRQSVEDSLSLFLDIIRAGVTVVTLNTGQEFRKGHIDTGSLMIATVKFATANEESAKKSFRLGEAWEAKRAKMNERPLTGKLPAWLRIENGKIVEDTAKADVVRTIFKLAIAGHGLTQITKAVNDQFKAIGRKGYFPRSSVSRILHSETTIGTFQPHKLAHDDNGKHREPVGKAIANYYPAVIDADTFYAAQKMMRDRKNTGGRSGQWVNVLQGLVFDADDKSPLRAVQKDYRCFASTAAIEGRKGASAYVSFTAFALEAAILQVLGTAARLDIADPTADTAAAELAAVEGRMTSLDNRIEQMAAALTTTGDIAAVVQVMGKMQAERKALDTQRAGLLADLAAAKHGTGNDALDIIHEALVAITCEDRDTPAEYLPEAGRKQIQADLDRRTTIRHALRQVVDRIDCRVAKSGLRRTCELAIKMRDGKTYKAVAESHVKDPWAVTIERGGKRSEIRVVAEAAYADHIAKATPAPTVSLQQIEEIKALWSRGFGGTEIARKMKTSISTVYRHKPEGWKARGKAGRPKGA